MRILKIQAKRCQEIDLTQAEKVCSKENLLCAIKDEMSKQEQSEVNKEKYLDTAKYLDEKEVITDYDTSIDENAFEGCHQKVKITYFSEYETIGKHFAENLRVVNSLIDDER